MAAGHETRALVENRPADAALGPYPGADHGGALVSAPLFRTRLVVVIGAGSPRPPGPPPQWSWLVDSSGTDPDADARRLLRRLEVAEGHVWVFPDQAATWAAAAKSAELLVLRYGNAVLRRQLKGPVRYEPAGRFWFAALSPPVHRRRAGPQQEAPADLPRT
ncbi:hypothetical protein ACFYNZ_20505 [Streptomyces kebangsaanensis]|uniref:Uncharacterized protein n=1 Tax=Streptomyces kebangsaanensis TaxID=864058 RepID=A0ABW6KVD1_9ACTN